MGCRCMRVDMIRRGEPERGFPKTAERSLGLGRLVVMPWRAFERERFCWPDADREAVDPARAPWRKLIDGVSPRTMRAGSPPSRNGL
jgi:hypothetical protein